MSSLLILFFIALTFNIHSSKATNPPVRITDTVHCNPNNLYSVSVSDSSVECRFRRVEPSFGQENQKLFKKWDTVLDEQTQCEKRIKRCSRNGENQIFFAGEKRPKRKPRRILKQIKKASQ
ncbi:hypothetical protein EUTSA_v10028187mg, partial [Eutrema salsugineum]